MLTPLLSENRTFNKKNFSNSKTYFDSNVRRNWEK